MKAVLLSAGLGKRLRPFTWFYPKQLIKIKGKSVIQRNIEYLHKFGIDKIYMNIHHKPMSLIKEVGDKAIYSYEPKLLGEEKTLEEMNWIFDEETLIVNSDTLTNLNLDKFWIKWSKDTSKILKFMSNGVYGGYRIIPPHGYNTGEIEYDDGSFFVDCGTWKGIRKATQIW